jgi:hypothetical protein
MVLAELEAQRYDQTPVTSSDHKQVYGLAPVSYLRLLHSSRKSLSGTDPLLQTDDNILQIHPTGELQAFEVSLSGFLLNLHRTPALLLAVHFDGEVKVHGLVTASDLNHRSLRRLLYECISSLETDLAALVRRECGDPWEWIAKLGEERQIRIVGGWEIARRRGMDIDPIANTSLTDLLQIVGKSKAVLELMGYRSRSEFEDQTGRIPDLRNRIMHAVRPFLLDAAGIPNLIRSIDGMEALDAGLAISLGKPVQPMTEWDLYKDEILWENAPFLVRPDN